MNGAKRAGRAGGFVHGVCAPMLCALALAPVVLCAVHAQDRFSAGAPPGVAAEDYRIGALDKLNITVFQVKDLTMENVQVDASGRILLPLVGAVGAQGRTTGELSAEIARRLGERFLQSPQVSVMVAEAVSQKVSVEGAVNEAGVFPLKGRTSLLEAVAMAKGASKSADEHHVAILRTVDGVTRSAKFDLASIRAGKTRNPEILAHDVVVVSDSKVKQFWHGVVEALPALVVFSYL